MKRLLLLLLAWGCAIGRGTPAPAEPQPGPSINPTAAASTTAPATQAPEAGPPTLRLPDTIRPVRYRPTLTIVPDQDGFRLSLRTADCIKTKVKTVNKIDVSAPSIAIEGSIAGGLANKTVAGGIAHNVGLGFHNRAATGTIRRISD